MRSLLLVESGLIGSDGRMRLPMDRVQQFTARYPGERVLVKIEVLEGHASARALRYYFGYVVPTLRQAFAKHGEILTERMVHDRLWREWPGEHDWAQDIREAPRTQVYNYIEWLKIYAATNLESYIEDPATI